MTSEGRRGQGLDDGRSSAAPRERRGGQGLDDGRSDAAPLERPGGQGLDDGGSDAAPVAGPPEKGDGARVSAIGRAQVLVDGRPLRFEPHNCFACGSLNVNGLQLMLHVEGETCWTELELPERFEGWEGIAHGGIVCTILDEVMAWALVGQDAWGLTARMTVEFKRPVPVGARLRAEGRLKEARRRLLTASAQLLDTTSGDVLASAEALYMAAPPDRKRELKRRYGFAEDEPLLSTGGTAR